VQWNTLRRKAEVLLDVLSEGIINLTVPRNRLLLASGWIDVNIMPASVPVQPTPPLL